MRAGPHRERSVVRPTRCQAHRAQSVSHLPLPLRVPARGELHTIWPWFRGTDTPSNYGARVAVRAIGQPISTRRPKGASSKPSSTNQRSTASPTSPSTQDARSRSSSSTGDLASLPSSIRRHSLRPTSAPPIRRSTRQHLPQWPDQGGMLGHTLRSFFERRARRRLPSPCNPLSTAPTTAPVRTTVTGVPRDRCFYILLVAPVAGTEHLELQSVSGGSIAPASALRVGMLRVR